MVSQAYGAKQFKLCGVYLNRARLINTVVFILPIILMCFSRNILTFLGQDPEVVEYARYYILVCLPGVYFEIMFDLKKRYLNCMSIAWMPMLVQMCGTLLHVVWCYLFVI